MNLMVFSDARLNVDFRKHLLDAARSSGASATHVFFPQYDQGDVLLTDDRATRSFAPRQVKEITDEILSRWSAERDILLTGLNGAFSRSAINIQRRLRPTLSFYDVYDDVRFGKRGLLGLKVFAKDLLWRRLCNYCLVHNPDLQNIYRNSAVLDTASHVIPSNEKYTQANENVLLYVGSVDERTDFELIEDLLRAGQQIHIYGRTHGRDASVPLILDRLTGEYESLQYFGAYDNDDISSILYRYKYGIMPYKIDCALTRYINPHKIYHYLNAGLIVYATEIPYIRFLKDYVHIIDRRENFDKLLSNLTSKNELKNWDYEWFTWQRRWLELGDLAVRAREVRR
jgi:hypothetical protein